MFTFKTQGVSWPPKGWKEFKMVDQSYGQAIVKNPSSATITGMSYVIEPVPVINKNNEQYYVYALRIEGWDYNIYNESYEYPILSFIFRDRPEENVTMATYMSELKTQAKKFPMTDRTAQRFFRAALFMVKQIAKGVVPDFEKTLKIYKIHATQCRLYQSRDYIPQHSMFCGLDVRASKILEYCE